MSYLPLEHYGIIGNLRTVALVGLNGSIDWWCHPHFDSPSIFGAILDEHRGGFCRIAPVSQEGRRKQFYWPSTNILVTRFHLEHGILELEDFMPVGLPPDSPWYRHLCRRVRCVRGSVKVAVQCQPAFNYGRDRHETTLDEHGVLFETPDLTISLSTKVPLEHDERGGVKGEFVLEEGGAESFILRALTNDGEVRCVPPDEETEQMFQTTVHYWQKWLSSCTYRGRWRQQVERSALALKLMTFEPTGAIVAAPTTSLPEVIGGSRNWDYRYTWLRDAAFTVYAFLRVGFRDEASAFMDWLTKYGAKHPHLEKPAPVVYTIHGDTSIPEWTLPHWEGYRGSAPVRIGNDAQSQVQNDIYGEAFDAVYLFNKHVAPIGYDTWQRLRRRLDWVCEHWRDKDEGIWEMRNRREHFVYSKIMNWVALDRGLRLADKRAFPAEREKWIRERDAIYEEVMTKGWNEKRQAFTQFYGSDDLDASLLMMPLVFFMAPNDPRMLSTLAAILKSPKDGGLVSDGLVYRYPAETRIDGLEGSEGTFNICTFWLVEALTRAGHAVPEYLSQARLLFERMLGYANHLGLFAEQTGAQGEALGNFPQAFTHLALISAAFNLDRALEERR